MFADSPGEMKKSKFYIFYSLISLIIISIIIAVGHEFLSTKDLDQTVRLQLDNTVTSGGLANKPSQIKESDKTLENKSEAFAEGLSDETNKGQLISTDSSAFHSSPATSKTAAQVERSPYKTETLEKTEKANNYKTQKKAVVSSISQSETLPPIDQTIIAIVIDDAGIDKLRTNHAIQLPGPLTFSFLTYANGLEEQAATARNAGHEIMSHIPMEPINPEIDPGPNALLIDLDSLELRRRLTWGLARLPGVVGINNHMGSKFTANLKAMNVVMEELKLRGLMFLDSRTTPHSVAKEVARKYKVPFVGRNIFLDHDPSLVSIGKQLGRLVETARLKGHAIAIAHPRDNTISALAQWLPILAEKGAVLVPVSFIVKRTSINLAPENNGH
ncbi:MAG: divergent polysaccharide deacetylase family protein [Pseudomonadota bacterium]|nr:divergent polysaccharide deacetylase family protein [Pseudomonadota bacterium]